MAQITRRLIVQGRVQGVGFRWSLNAEANKLGLNGWVRNLRNGDVEVLVCGAPEAVDQLTAWAHRGPSSARVDRVLFNDEPNVENNEIQSGFRQRPTF